MNSDVLIIGGGVIGLSIARELHKRGAGRITIVEKGRCGKESSWAAAGMLGPQAETDETGPFFDLCCTSRDMYPRLASELLDETGIDIELDQTGTLHAAFDDEDLEHLRTRYQWQKNAGLPVDLLSADEVRSIEPLVSPDIRAALFFPNDWQVENRKLLAALRRYADLNDITVIESTPVDALRIDGRKVIGAAAIDGDLDADQTILATGAWTSFIKLGTMELPVKVEPVRGQMVAFTSEETMFRHVIYGRNGYIVPRRDGRILAGSTTEKVGFDVSTTASAIDSLKEMAGELIPDIKSLPVSDQWAGLRPFAADGMPVLGAVHSIEGLFVATAHYRNGILLAPVTAKVAAQSIVDGVRSRYCETFGVDRLGTASAGAGR